MLDRVRLPQPQFLDVFEGEPLFGEKGGSPSSEAVGSEMFVCKGEAVPDVMMKVPEGMLVDDGDLVTRLVQEGWEGLVHRGVEVDLRVV